MTPQEQLSELEKVNSQLRVIKTSCRRNFQDMVNLLTSVISLSSHYLGGHLRRVAEMSKELTAKMLPDGKETSYAVYYAGLLHDLGLVGENETLITTPNEALSPDQQKEYKKHPVRGENIISTVYDFKKIASFIRHHHEDFNGGGYPDGISGQTIPLGARIIRIVSDFDNRLYKNGDSMVSAMENLQQLGGIYYDPEVLEQFGLMLRSQGITNTENTKSIRELKEGLFLLDDIYLENGMLLIPKGVFLNTTKMNKIKSFSSLIQMEKKVKIRE